jgi:protein TonB
LAVAVVEGQAGVAKAFRIGANLVLTRPINVEQAKGTLRVARGLLRKGESSKATASAVPEPKPEPKPAQLGFAAAHAVPKAAQESSFPEPEVKIAEVVLEALPLPLPPPAPQINASAPALPQASPPREKIPPAPSAPAPSPVATSSPSGAASAPARAREPIAISPPQPASDILMSPEELELELEQNASGEDPSAGQAPPAFTFETNKASSPRSKKALLAIAAIVLLIAAAYFAWIQFGLARRLGISLPALSLISPTPRPASTAPQPAPAPPALLATVAAPAQASDPVPSGDSPDASSAPSPEPPPSAQTPADKNKDKNKEKDNFVSAAGLSQPAPRTYSYTSPQTTSQVIKLRKVSATSTAPLDMNAIASNRDPIPNLLTPSSSAPVPRLQALTVSQGVSRGLLIKETQPVYPQDALRHHIEGSVQLLATVSKEGDISTVKIISGDSRLSRSAADAVKQWKYKPYLLNGEPVEIQTQVTVNFK